MTPRLIHPVPVTLQLVDLHHPDSPTPPVTLPAQVTWRRCGDAGFHAHAPTTLYAGSLAFSAATIDPLLQAKSLVKARVLTVAGYDYTDADLVISHLVPLAHRGVPRLIKAFFSAEVVPLENATVSSNLLEIQP
ncbi:MAG: hypothetical protein AAF471_05030 [Myxococcota bacterium]